MSNALQMMKTGNLNPNFFLYPSLYIYFQLINSMTCYLYSHSTGVLTGLSEIQTRFDTGWFWEISHPMFFLWGRALTALLGSFSVFVIFLLGREVKDKRTGLLAALFLAFAPGHVFYSKIIAVDVPTALFSTITVYFSLLGYNSGRRMFFL